MRCLLGCYAIWLAPKLAATPTVWYGTYGTVPTVPYLDTSTVGTYGTSTMRTVLLLLAIYLTVGITVGKSPGRFFSQRLAFVVVPDVQPVRAASRTVGTLYQLQPSFHIQSKEPEPTART